MKKVQYDPFGDDYNTTTEYSDDVFSSLSSTPSMSPVLSDIDSFCDQLTNKPLTPNQEEVFSPKTIPRNTSETNDFNILETQGKIVSSLSPRLDPSHNSHSPRMKKERSWRTAQIFQKEKVLNVVGSLEGFNIEDDHIPFAEVPPKKMCLTTAAQSQVSLISTSASTTLSSSTQSCDEETKKKTQRDKISHESCKEIICAKPPPKSSPSDIINQSLQREKDRSIKSKSEPYEETSDEHQQINEQSLIENSNTDLSIDTSTISSSDSLTLMFDKPTKSYRERILDEFVSSEYTYVIGLKICSKFFEEPLSKQQKYCPPNLFSIVFKGFDDVYRINSNLLQELNNLKNHVDGKSLDTHLGEAFSQFIPLLNVYKTYVGNTEAQFAALDRLESKSSFKKLCFNLQSKISVGHALNLRSYLITPVQRLPRYKLLLEDLIRNTPEGHCDLARLKNALDKVMSINLNVNHSVDIQSRQQKLIELSKKIKGIDDLIQPNRYYICDGELTRINQKGKKIKHFYLFNDRLISGKPGNEVIVSFDEKIVNIMIQDDSDISFNILSPNKSFEILCTNEEEKRDWFEKIIDAINTENQLVPVQHSKKAIEYAPLWLPQSIQKCQLCGKAFSLINRKQFCIHCGLCVCNGCYRGRFIFNGVNKRGCDRCMKKALAMNKIIIDDDISKRKTIRMKSSKEDEIVLRLEGVNLTRVRSNANVAPIRPLLIKKPINENEAKKD
ncbi:Rho guanine nucleotide exchange factor, putative [Entamoeba histolytica HM-1:IMSS-B]|uniref:Rho guanine nucleotide exchange factor, putative n=6 Tax=Entamoeba histolytica TaxID=5759 RepID=C4M0U5_ENTH1|nr:Rho guanine nucleotide exchange factor, putative [Entamoeba histolytica HM-1:IMSS]EMD45531.1 rho/RAC guanine nucleotide exchange factor, putative [Entamoeba histolytica KU27]EMH78036.1 Rho guanine nucleotide exchange factor, putative [Entamoeba histolytica HM-1:IMSS-B]EMS14364.1 Rho/RAC guanine nucleotide exchange factor, putative [Entamoeba histolytica HM-3:IMSS]ENY59766.1 Rho/RAC guanine nucleotide exchange factor, putative [Entamoeba histolytica HM-1:IMSS-A]GAT94786.1 rho guanine nucleot|eukprot:XP_651711.2 Rho guanine nucleotide exchange factor, putative [Entamoeba histolytica HM-1:IMSS]